MTGSGLGKVPQTVSENAQGFCPDSANHGKWQEREVGTFFAECRLPFLFGGFKNTGAIHASHLKNPEKDSNERSQQSQRRQRPESQFAHAGVAF
jgi:hypothetical protein